MTTNVRIIRKRRSVWVVCEHCNTIITVLWKGYFRDCTKEPIYKVREFCYGCGKLLDYTPINSILRSFGIRIAENQTFVYSNSKYRPTTERKAKLCGLYKGV